MGPEAGSSAPEAARRSARRLPGPFYPAPRIAGGGAIFREKSPARNAPARIRAYSVYRCRGFARRRIPAELTCTGSIAGVAIHQVKQRLARLAPADILGDHSGGA